MSEYFYRGQPLSTYSLWDLGLVEKTIKDTIAKREEAAKHPRLAKINIKLPSPNVEFLKLKDAIETEIKNRQKVNDNA